LENKMKRLAHILLFTALLSSQLSAQTTPPAHTSEIKNANGVVIGSIHVFGSPNGVLLLIEVRGLTPGWHGMHFHETGDCSDSAFKNAGAHVHAASPVVHGLLNSGANDAGDLPNLYVSQDGTATVEVYSTLVSLDGSGGLPKLLDADGSALVIHANPDDYTTQPIGGSGARVACGVIK
jgi:superoxide dismutase, Cu-Zn family